MSSPLSAIPVAKRRQAAATLGLFAALFVALGVVAATGRNTAAAPVFSAVAIVVAVVLAALAWGVVRSISADRAEERLDAAILDALAARPEYASLCSCGHEHDPGVLHLVDEHSVDDDSVDEGSVDEHSVGESSARVQDDGVCAHDGAGAACAHDCSTCVLAGMRRVTH